MYSWRHELKRTSLSDRNWRAAMTIHIENALKKMLPRDIVMNHRDMADKISNDIKNAIICGVNAVLLDQIPPSELGNIEAKARRASQERWMLP